MLGTVPVKHILSYDLILLPNAGDSTGINSFVLFHFNIPGCVSINMQSVQGRNHMDLGMSLGALAQFFF